MERDEGPQKPRSICQMPPNCGGKGKEIMKNTTKKPGKKAKPKKLSPARQFIKDAATKMTPAQKTKLREVMETAKVRKEFEDEITLRPGGRNFAHKPYSDDEKRVAQWFFTVAGVGGGEDPIGSMIASHEWMAHERKELKQKVAALQLDNDRLYLMASPKQQQAWMDEKDGITHEKLQRDAVNKIIEKAKK